MPPPSVAAPRRARWLSAVLVVLGLTGLLVASPPAVAASGPVVLDDFAGQVRGARTVTGLAEPQAGEAPPGSFVELGGQATIRATGGGSADGGVRLDYTFDPTDLGPGSAGSRLSLVIDAVRLVPEPAVTGARAEITITVTDADGADSTYETTVTGLGGSDVAVDLSCAAGGPCLAGEADLTEATHLAVVIRSAAELGTAGSLEVVLDTISTVAAPDGGPSASTGAGSPAVDASAAPAFVGAAPPATRVGQAYRHQFRAHGQPAPAYAVADGELPPGLALTAPGLLAGTPTVAGRYGFTVRAENADGSDTQVVALDVAAPLTRTGPGVTVSPRPTPTSPERPRSDAPDPLLTNRPPVITSRAQAVYVRGTAGSFAVEAGGSPRPSLAVVGDLPAGLRLIDHGEGTAAIEGTPLAPGGRFEVLLTARGAGRATQTLTLTVGEVPSVTTVEPVRLMVGTAGRYEIRSTGYPVPTLTVTDLPAGMSVTDHGDGTATISGTPTRAGADGGFAVIATNDVGSAVRTVRLVVGEAPRWISGDRVDFARGQSGSTTLRTAGEPDPDLTVEGELPAGLTVLDNGNGTATLAGSPTDSGTVEVTLVARSSGVPGARQRLQITVS